MNSGFRFISYKVDSVELKMRNNLFLLSKKIFDEDWDVEIGMRIPQYFTGNKVYLAGLDCTMTYPPLEGDESKEPSIFLTAGIMGLFEVDEGRFPPEMEKKFVRSHLPTLVMPYVRATMTSLLANAGIGIHIFPLVNMHEIASKTLKDEEIIVNP
jgi:preprotein translocase subunit SecB